MLKRLKAPWSFCKQNGIPGHCIVAQVFDKDGKALAHIESNIRQDIVNEQAKLMAAAPELLEALQLAVTCSNFKEAKKNFGNTKNHWTSIIERAIKKATV